MTQEQVPPKTQREIDRADPYRWSDWEILIGLSELGLIALFTPPFVASLLFTLSMVALAVWVLAKLG